MAVSGDGVNWTKHGRDLIQVRLEEHECQASPDVFELSGRFHMYFSYRYCLGFQNKDRGYRIGYAWSDDLLHWTRDDASADIHASTEGWDSETVSYPHVFRVDDKLYMLYQGNQVGRTGFGAARLVSDDSLQAFPE